MTDRTRNAGLAAALTTVALLGASCAGAAPAPAAPAGTSAAPRSYTAAPVKATITFYAAFDNDPSGSTDIAYPGERRRTAGGTGTFEDPITMATDPREIPIGGVIYVPGLRKYFVMEDGCGPCVDEWGASRSAHVALWIPGGTDARVGACEDALSPAAPAAIEYDPPPGRTVDTKPLFAGGRCWPAT